jgi:hypothetical protein
VRHFRPGALIAVVASAALLAWLLASCGDQSVPAITTTKSVKPFRPQALSVDSLKTISSVLGQPIYWAGAKAGYTYEFRRTRDGNIYLRYLPPGTAVGSKGSFLTIATYPVRDAYGAIVRASKRKGSVAVSIPSKGLAVYAPRSPRAYYFAYPGTKYQIEVLAPTAAVARRLVLQTLVVPVR